jgi:hypothetical protein
MPKSSKKRQEFSRKKPFLAAAVLCLILIVFATGFFYQQIAHERQAALSKLKGRLTPLKISRQPMTTASYELTRAAREADHYAEWLEDRVFWGKMFMTVREVMLSVEDKKEKELGTPNVGVWVEKWAPILPSAGYLTEGLTTNALVTGGPGGSEFPATAADPMRPPERPRGGGGKGRDGLLGDLRNRTNPQSTAGNTNATVQYFLLTCRSVNMNKPVANTGIAEAVTDELKGKTTFFDPNMTKLIGDILGADSTNLTISFQIQVKLLRPVKL